MLFNSWEFILGFLPASLLGFFMIPAERLSYRKIWLIAASLFFYGWWKIEYVPLLIFSMFFNYAVALLIHRWRGQRAARATLAIGVAVNLLLLGYFKYTNFLLGTFGLLTHHPPLVFDIALPLAISFFTFTQIGFIVDVSRDPELHYSFLDYVLFVTFFPHLIAGPIVRHWEVIPQFAKRALRASEQDLAGGQRVSSCSASTRRCCWPMRPPVMPTPSTAPAAAGQTLALVRRLAGHDRLYPADLLRFLRLFGHGHRPGPALRDQVPLQLRFALPRRLASPSSGGAGTCP